MSRPIATIGCNFPVLKEGPIMNDPHLDDQFFPENSFCLAIFPLRRGIFLSLLEQDPYR